MLKRAMQIWRGHPVLVGAAVGAIFGAGNAILIEAGGLWQGSSNGVLSLFLPAAHRPPVGQTDIMQTALLLLIEIAGNVLGFSLLFAVPVALFVGIRGMFGRHKRAASPEERP
jgi:hypothetical protein